MLFLNLRLGQMSVPAYILYGKYCTGGYSRIGVYGGNALFETCMTFVNSRKPLLLIGGL